MNWDNENHLVVIELLAEENGWIASEDELSEQFDEQVVPGILEEHGTKGQEFTDTAMVSVAFNNWSDMLCKEGEIHLLQYDQYCYVGRYS